MFHDRSDRDFIVAGGFSRDGDPRQTLQCLSIPNIQMGELTVLAFAGPTTKVRDVQMFAAETEFPGPVESDGGGARLQSLIGARKYLAETGLPFCHRKGVVRTLI